MDRVRILLLALVATAATGASADRAEINYIIHCMGCHLVDGSGFPPDVPDVRGEMGRLLSVDGGRRYMVQVPGAAQAQINDAELADVITYMARTFSSETLPEDFENYTEAEVARWRVDWLSDVLKERAVLFERLGEEMTH